MAACGEGNTPTAVPSTPDPQYSFANNPDNGNPRITRYGVTDFAFSWTDPKTGLRATHTSFSLGTEPGCGPGETLDPLDAQDVGLADFNDILLSWAHTNMKGEVWIIVRDTNRPGDCAGNALIAEGLGKVHLTDNDVFAWYPEEGSIRNNDNSWGFMAQGTLTGVNGEKMQYSGHYRLVWDPQNQVSHVELAEVVIH
jgi:hypothetical protein